MYSKFSTLCTPPPPAPDDQSGPSLPTNEGPGIIGQAVCRTQKLSGGDSVGNLHVNAICVGGKR